jgi:CHASE2 domain-containing sensor protein
LNARIFILRHRKALIAGALTVLCGLTLWKIPLGETWENASYDYIFRFSARAVTQQVVLIVMDNEAYQAMGQERNLPWNRALHAQLLNRLADDGCALTVFDVFFEQPGDTNVDEALAGAMRRQSNIVLMGWQTEVAERGFEAAKAIPPTEPFLSAARTNWGVAWLDPDLGLGDTNRARRVGDKIIRGHWPFAEPGFYLSLPVVTARLVDDPAIAEAEKRWVRYYGERGAWMTLSYHRTFDQATNFFRDKIVFIGNKPETSLPDDEKGDEFRTPYTRWTGRSAGGVEILVTEFLNLVNREWLRRTAGWLEILVLVVAGALMVLALHRVRPLSAVGIAVASALGVVLAGVSLSYFTNYWFPYLIIAGGQIPVALACKLVTAWRPEPVTRTVYVRGEAAVAAEANVPDYEIIEPPFGEGAYGRVWLARNAVGQWQAFKSIYLAKFNNNPGPYEREFNGIKRYKPISDKHPGLLRVDFVSRKKAEGYFYYVMELADSMTPGWEEKPSLYKPRDLAAVRAQAPARRLPIKECLTLGIVIAEALEFLHSQKLTHRDIKPSNILFVNGRPKLGDVGLVSDVKPASPDNTQVGTPFYMPPPPEPLGTVQADIYGLGMVLYVISTGREPALFPELSATLVEETEHAEFLRWNQIIIKACNPDCAQRYLTAAELQAALMELRSELTQRGADFDRNDRREG